MSSVNTPVTARRQTRQLTFEEWVLPASATAASLAAALEDANTHPGRGEQHVWYRTDHTPDGPVLVIGFTLETVA